MTDKSNPIEIKTSAAIPRASEKVIWVGVMADIGLVPFFHWINESLIVTDPEVAIALTGQDWRSDEEVEEEE